MQLGEDEFARAVDGDEEVELAFLGADLGDVDVEEADRVGLEGLLARLVAVDLGQPADPVPLQQAMKSRTCQVRFDGLQGV